MALLVLPNQVPGFIHYDSCGDLLYQIPAGYRLRTLADSACTDFDTQGFQLIKGNNYKQFIAQKGHFDG